MVPRPSRSCSSTPMARQRAVPPCLLASVVYLLTACLPCCGCGVLCVQALAAAMRKLREEWWVLVVQLEHQHKLGQLNLAALLYYCQAPSASLALLASIAVSAHHHRAPNHVEH